VELHMEESEPGVLHRRLHQEALGKGVDQCRRRQALLYVGFMGEKFEVVNRTSSMPVQLMKLIMSASVTVRPIVLNCRPTGRSSKKRPSPTVSMPRSCRPGRPNLSGNVNPLTSG